MIAQCSGGRVFRPLLYLPFLDPPRIFFSALALSCSPLSLFLFLPSFFRSRPSPASSVLCPSVRRSSAPTSTSSLFLYIALFRQQRKSGEAAPHAATPEERAPLCRVKIFPSEFGASYHQKLGRKALSDERQGDASCKINIWTRLG